MLRNITRLAGVALCGLLFAGCTNVAPFGYSEAQEPQASFGMPEAKSVAVLPFLDGRTMEKSESGSFYWGLFPLMPYGYLKKPFPERGEDFVSLGRFHFDPVEDLAAASVLGLKASKLFEQVSLARSTTQAGDAEFLWRGTLTDSTYSGALLTYGITYFAAPVLWAVGAPEGVSRNTLGVRFELISRATGKVVWSYDYLGTDSVVHWIYARVGKDTSLYPELMRRAMNQALADLSRKLPELR